MDVHQCVNGQVLWTPTGTWSRNVVVRSELSHFAEIAPDCVLSYLPHRGVPATRARGESTHGRGQAGQPDRAALRVPTVREQSHEDAPPQPAKAGPYPCPRLRMPAGLRPGPRPGP